MPNSLLNYKKFGDEGNPNTIILLHGMLGSMDNWRSQAKRLSTHFHVITPDLRNHGRSPHLSGMRYQDMAQDILDLCSYLGLKQFDLLGHSMGGKVAMEIALKEGTVVERLVIVDIAPRPYSLTHLKTFKALLSLPVNDLDSRSQADELLSKHIENPFERAFLLKNLKSSTSGYSWRCNLQEITRAYLNIANFTQKASPSFSGKTLFIRGADSPYVDENNDLPVINNFFPHATLKTIKKAGHNPHTEQSDIFYQTISGFLELS